MLGSAEAGRRKAGPYGCGTTKSLWSEIMLDAELSARIMRAVDDGFDAQVQLTQELVRFPSVRGAEATAQDFVAREMRARGLAVDRWEIDVDKIRHLPGFSPVHAGYDDALNVVGAHRGGSGAGK